MKHINRLRVKPIDSRCFRLSEELGVRFGFRGPVDRHGLRPRDDKSDGFPFPLHSSPFTLPSLAFLETYTEAYAAAAVTGGAAVAPS